MNEPQLGLATTEELFRELIARFVVDMNLGSTERAVLLAEMLGGLDALAREYRTVDGREVHTPVTRVDRNDG